MKIFPAIDIKDKKCVRLIKGDFENKTEYETSPIDQAGKYKDHGFKNLHIVDLDGALTGKTVNLNIIKEIVGKYDLKIEIGGGVRNIESINQYIDSGAEKVILGSGAIRNKEFLKYFNIPINSADAYSLSSEGFSSLAKSYGKMGGLDRIATVVKSIRSERPNALLLDGGDTWQGSYTALKTNGMDMVKAFNLLGVNAMTSHWAVSYTHLTLPTKA